MKYFYLGNFFIEKNYDTEAKQILDIFQNLFQNNTFIKNQYQIAIIIYTNMNYPLNISKGFFNLIH